MNAIAIGEVCVEFYATEKGDMTKPTKFVGPFPSGAPCNYLAQLNRLGLSCGIIGSVGKDIFGKVVLKRLSELSINTDLVKLSPDKATAIAFAAYDKYEQRHFVFTFKDSALGELDEKCVEDTDISKAKTAHIVGSGMCINEKTIKSTYKFAEIAYKHNLLVTLDPNIRKELIDIQRGVRIVERLYPFINILTPNEMEAQWLTGEHNPEKAALQLVKRGIPRVVVTLGEKGSILATQGTLLREESYSVKSVDPTGAGDVHAAAITYGFLKEWSDRDILRFANAAAALATMKYGAMMVATKAEIHHFLSSAKKPPILS